jgi:hypothetical protein
MSPTRLLSGLSSVALVVLGLVALLPDCASACSCAVPPGSEQEQARRELADSSAVFAGEVIDIEKGPQVSSVTFEVSKVWKGRQREIRTVSTPSYGAACGYPFKEGKEYLVYAWGKKMEVYLCGRTTLLSKASADLEVLGNGETMGGSGAVLSDTSGGFLPLGAMGMLGGAVAAVSLVVLMRLVRTS